MGAAWVLCGQLNGPASPTYLSKEAQLAGATVASLSGPLAYDGPFREQSSDPAAVGVGLEEGGSYGGDSSEEGGCGRFY